VDVEAAVRALHTAAAVLIAGSFAFALLVLRHDDVAAPTGVERGEIVRWIRLAGCGSVLVCIATWFVWLALVAARMSGRPLGEALDARLLGTVLTHTTFGRVWVFRLAAMLLLAAMLFAARAADGATVGRLDSASGVLAAMVLVTLAGAGHAAGAPASVRPLHLAVDALHVLGAGLWLGALVPLLRVLLRARNVRELPWAALATVATQRFSRLGQSAVGLLVASGLLNAWFLVGSFEALVQTPYGRLVSMKIVLLACMLAIAAVNRLRLAPRLAHGSHRDGASAAAVQALVRNVLAEIVLGSVVLAIACSLATLPPPGHEHPMHMLGVAPKALASILVRSCAPRDGDDPWLALPCSPSPSPQASCSALVLAHRTWRRDPAAVWRA
jgi:putative copper resistance protein D